MAVEYDRINRDNDQHNACMAVKTRTEARWRAMVLKKSVVRLRQQFFFPEKCCFMFSLSQCDTQYAVNKKMPIFSILQRVNGILATLNIESCSVSQSVDICYFQCKVQYVCSELVKLLIIILENNGLPSQGQIQWILTTK